MNLTLSEKEILKEKTEYTGVHPQKFALWIAMASMSMFFAALTSALLVKKGDYLRLKSVTLGYSLSKSLISKIKISSLRIYVQAENLFTVTGFKGWDFEPVNADLGSYGVSNIVYPHSKSITFGLNVSFTYDFPAGSSIVAILGVIFILSAFYNLIRSRLFKKNT